MAGELLFDNFGVVAMLLEEVTERVNGLQFVNSDTSEPSLLPTSCDYLDGGKPVVIIL
jgi:hypothetical protein